MNVAFDNTYARLPDRFHARVSPARVREPRVVKVNRALALFELEQYEPAARLLDEVLAANPNNLRALFQRKAPWES